MELDTVPNHNKQRENIMSRSRTKDNIDTTLKHGPDSHDYVLKWGPAGTSHPAFAPDNDSIVNWLSGSLTVEQASPIPRAMCTRWLAQEEAYIALHRKRFIREVMPILRQLAVLKLGPYRLSTCPPGHVLGDYLCRENYWTTVHISPPSFGVGLISDYMWMPAHRSTEQQVEHAVRVFDWMADQIEQGRAKYARAQAHNAQMLEQARAKQIALGAVQMDVPNTTTKR